MNISKNYSTLVNENLTINTSYSMSAINSLKSSMINLNTKNNSTGYLLKDNDIVLNSIWTILIILIQAI
ncbi:MAG: hypothetical protein ACJA2S_003126 [Cyclobacteriaceae bacterium]